MMTRDLIKVSEHGDHGVMVETGALCCVRHTGLLIAAVIDRSCERLQCSPVELMDAIRSGMPSVSAIGARYIEH
jgi:hypothetical protein